MVVSLSMFDGLEGSKVKVTNLNQLITVKQSILDTKFVLVTDKKSYVSFQMVLSPLILDDLEWVKLKVTNQKHLIALRF